MCLHSEVYSVGFVLLTHVCASARPILVIVRGKRLKEGFLILSLLFLLSHLMQLIYVAALYALTSIAPCLCLSQTNIRVLHFVWLLCSQRQCRMMNWDLEGVGRSLIEILFLCPPGANEQNHETFSGDYRWCPARDPNRIHIYSARLHQVFLMYFFFSIEGTYLL